MASDLDKLASKIKLSKKVSLSDYDCDGNFIRDDSELNMLTKNHEPILHRA